MSAAPFPAGAVLGFLLQAAAPCLVTAQIPQRTVELSFSYTGELIGNAGGGARRGGTYVGLAGVEGTLFLGRLIGWHGARIVVAGMGTWGGDPANHVGDLQGVSNLQAPDGVRLEEAWLQQNLLGNRLSWLAGRYDLNSEFYRLQSATLFVNSSFGIGPEVGLSGRGGPSIYPDPSVGTRIDFKPSPEIVARLAVLDGVPVGRPGGVRFFAPGDGLLLFAEVAILWRPDSAGEPHQRRFRVGRGQSRSYAAKVAIGGWYYTGRFDDLSETAAGVAVQHQGSGGAYLIADRTLWSGTGSRPSALAAFLQLGLGDGRVNQVGGYLGAGLTLSAPWIARKQDQVGLALAAARNGSHFARARPVSGPATAGETAIELTYLAQLNPWLTLQPDLQYVLHPGGTRARGNAVVFGLRVAAAR